ncbi:MAG: DUF2064 domain-containing protein, partial [Steroidobacteraceae bacterium]|nr:DUF2064 domain-containing protein [Steroidobacteraceae bacterium]
LAERRAALGAAAQPSVLAQIGGTLGARLQRLDATLRASGYERLLFIGTDAPGLDREQLVTCARQLARTDVVLAPARDGGVVAMGARRPWPPLAGLPWSTTRLRASLRAACRAAGLSVATGPQSFDIDRATDLWYAARRLARDPRPARRALVAAIAALRAQRVARS